jgi:hypothetical protein
MQLFVGGYEVTQLEGQGDELYVHRKALKALHVLFDMEVRVTHILVSAGAAAGPACTQLK